MSALVQNLNLTALLALLANIVKGKCDDSADQRRAIYVFGVRVVSAGLIYFSQVLLARWMGSFEFGVYAYVWVLTSIFGVLSTFGMNTVVLRFIPQYKENGETGHLNGLLFTSRLFSLGLGVLIGVVGYLTLMLFQEAIPEYYLMPLILALVCLPFYGLMDVQESIGRAEGWISLGLLPIFIIRPIILLVFMAGAIYFGAPANASTCLLVLLVATVFLSVAQWAMMHGKTRKYQPDNTHKFEMKHWVGVALPLLFMDGFYLFMTHTDILVINAYLSPTDVAIYYAAMKTTFLIAFVKYAIISVSAPKFSQLYTAGKMEELNNYVKKSITWTFWPSALAAVGIVVLGMPFLWMFGEQFMSGYPLILVLVFGLLAGASVGPTEILLNMVGRQKFVAGVLFGSCVLNLVLNVLLVPIYGIMGAAIATTLSVFVSTAAMFWGAKSLIGIHCFIVGGSQTER